MTSDWFGVRYNRLHYASFCSLQWLFFCIQPKHTTAKYWRLILILKTETRALLKPHHPVWCLQILRFKQNLFIEITERLVEWTGPRIPSGDESSRLIRFIKRLDLVLELKQNRLFWSRNKKLNHARHQYGQKKKLASIWQLFQSNPWSLAT